MTLPPVPTRRPAAAPAAGFTLLEVLVAIVVLSFGVLGMVGLQAAALQSNKEARYQASAARLGRELADLMRSNNLVAAASTNNPYLVADFTAASTLPNAPEDCVAVNCASTQNVASFQMRDWVQRVINELPGARVTVCFDQAPYDQTGGQTGRPHWLCTGDGSIVAIKIGWTRRDTTTDSTTPMLLGAVTGDGEARPIIVMTMIPG